MLQQEGASISPTRPGLLQYMVLPFCILFSQLSVGFAQVALARHSKSKLFLCTRLLATFSVLCTLLSTKIVKMIPFLQMLKKDFQAI